MFKKILIAEDFDSYNIAVKKTVEELNVSVVDQVFYCDDALLKIQHALLAGAPYELLISDLSFNSDYREQRLLGGEDLIQEARKEQPSLKVIIFSIENRFHKIKTMFDKYQINGFVSKGRNDAKELKKAITTIYEGQNYISNNDSVQQNNIYEFSEYDINLLKLLSQGYTQKEVEHYLKKNNITPNSESSIEKRLAILRESLDAKDTKQLLSIVIELGII
ncbi:response regulator transcription factor [Apibacter sp. HY039]|uniref:response regulator transcription factor n=1 Tax=Apibacter sp. HY039 TaxID=2501476 RepID=UPI000FEC03CF|nr:response regulator transcription factor [Apibacter sp. HY039]